MSEFKKRISEQVKMIDEIISDENEKVQVMHVIQDMISNFTSHIISLNERQNEIDDKITEIYDVLTNIESNLYDDMDNSPFTVENCPYCGEQIPIDSNKTEDIECPFCHKMIEVEDNFRGESFFDFSKGKKEASLDDDYDMPYDEENKNDDIFNGIDDDNNDDDNDDDEISF